MLTTLSVLATVAAAVLVYLAGAHQRLLPAARRPGRLRFAALLALAAGQAGWAKQLQGAAVVAVPLLLLMLAWVLLPYLDAAGRILRAGGAGVEDRPRR